jgi:O-antigen biosynthesis protein
MNRKLQAIQHQLEFRVRELERELELAKAERDQYRGRVQAIESSKFWQLRARWIALKNRLGSQESLVWAPELPELPLPEPITIPTGSDYDHWRDYNAPRPADYRQMRETVEIFPHKPLISILVPVYNTPEAYLRAMLESVLAQIYPHWELCIADDASTAPHIQAILEEYSARDRRIKLTVRSENGHISAASNSALALATGEFVALLDHDDLLAPEALYEVALLLNRHPEADFIYSDEDKIDDEGQFSRPAFKPDWAPDSFLCRMYTCHLGVYRRSIVEQIGGFRVGYEGSQDYDLVLRFTEQSNRVFHIPKVLYHWRIHPHSTAQTSAAKPYAYDASERALQDALQRRNELGDLLALAQYPGHYIIRYQILEPKRVSILIPTRDLGEMLDQCLASIFNQSHYPNYEVIVIDNGSIEADTQTLFKKWQNLEPERFRVHSLDIPFNYSKLNNFAVTQASGEFLLFLNNDTTVITPDWIEAMVEQARRPSIGAVGAKLLYPDQTIQHAGVVLGIAAGTGHSHKHFPAEAFGYMGQIVSICNYAAVTGACLMCRRQIFEQVGGFEETLTVGYNDIDLCLKFLEQGLRNVYLPHVQLYHYESKSRGQDLTPEKQARFFQETAWMRQRWPVWMERDPYYSPNLTTRHETYQIRDPELEG